MDLSGKISSDIVQIYRVVSSVAAELGIPFFVVGATARDIVLELGYGIKPSRATLDIDLGVKVADWEQFEKLSKQLVATKKFRCSRSAQTLFYENGLPVDIIPFGKISGEDAYISWPPKDDIRMNVLGFDEAYSTALLVRLNSNPNLEIHFASPAGWALLKIFSWCDRSGEDRTKDALDLSLILRNYAEAGNEERLFDTEARLLEEEDYDSEYAGARLLGKDIALIATRESLGRIAEILEQETEEKGNHQLAVGMVPQKAFVADEFDKNLSLLEKLKQGLGEVS